MLRAYFVKNRATIYICDSNVCADRNIFFQGRIDINMKKLLKKGIDKKRQFFKLIITNVFQKVHV